MSTWGSGWTVGVTKPSSSNTGTGILDVKPTAVHTGNYTITTSGTVVKNLIVKGQILIKANNVTVQNCSVSLTNSPTAALGCIEVAAGYSGAKIQYNNIFGGKQDIYYKGIRMYGSGTVQYNYIHAVVDGIDIYSGKSLVYANFIDSLQLVTPDAEHPDNRSHCDGIQVLGGTGHIFKGNNITGLASTTYSSASLLSGHPQALSSMMFTPFANTPITGFSVANNWFGGGEECLNFGAKENTSTSGSVTNNTFTANQYNAGWFIDLYSGGTKVSCSGNKTTTGAAVSPKKG